MPPATPCRTCRTCPTGTTEERAQDACRLRKKRPHSAQTAAVCCHQRTVRGGGKRRGKRVTADIAKTSPSLTRKGERGRRICGGRHAKHLLALFHTIAVRRGRQRRQPATPYKKLAGKVCDFSRGCKVLNLAEGARGARSHSKNVRFQIAFRASSSAPMISSLFSKPMESRMSSGGSPALI